MIGGCHRRGGEPDYWNDRVSRQTCGQRRFLAGTRHWDKHVFTSDSHSDRSADVALLARRCGARQDEWRRRAGSDRGRDSTTRRAVSCRDEAGRYHIACCVWRRALGDMGGVAAAGRALL
jgi:hypothetical protein